MSSGGEPPGEGGRVVADAAAAGPRTAALAGLPVSSPRRPAAWIKPFRCAQRSRGTGRPADAGDLRGDGGRQWQRARAEADGVGDNVALACADVKDRHSGEAPAFGVGWEELEEHQRVERLHQAKILGAVRMRDDAQTAQLHRDFAITHGYADHFPRIL